MLNAAHKLIASHLVDGTMRVGSEIALRIDQVLLQDILGTLVMQELEMMGVDRVSVDPAVQYVDHNLVENDHLNGDEHLFLRSAARRFGIWYSRAGNGISHPVHMERFGKPGASLVGSDSHTPASGGLGMLAIGAGGVEVALALAGEPLVIRMPKVWGVHLTGELPDWVSAKDVILEMLRRHGVEGALDCILEYHGPGLACLSAMDRHVIANMGAELGATTTVFPSDEATRLFLCAQGRESDWSPVAADPNAAYDLETEIDLSSLEPLIARPSSPGNVVRVRDVAGEEISQAYIGSSANPGFRDFAVAAHMVRGRTTHDRVSFDLNPGTRQVLQALSRDGLLGELLAAGGRLHQPGCNGCCGMGQAPASGRNSLRTVPRNFPGRSGTREDSVFLCSPETATASALAGVITDPRDLGLPYPRIVEPENMLGGGSMMVKPLSSAAARNERIDRTPNIAFAPNRPPIADELRLPVLLKVGDDVSTDGIIPGASVMSISSNIPRLADFAFQPVDASYPDRARAVHPLGHAIVAANNYGQGSSRETAALVPRHLGLQVVMARSIARLHWQNLPNFGVLPLTFVDPDDYDAMTQGDEVVLTDLHRALLSKDEIIARVTRDGRSIAFRCSLSARQREVLLAGGMIPWMRERLQHRSTSDGDCLVG